MNQPQPRLQGTFEQTPFVHLVLHALHSSLSGTLVIDRGGFETKVLFREGRAVAAKPLPRGTELSRGLLELCLLEDNAFALWDGDLVRDAPELVRGTVDPLLFVGAVMRQHLRDSDVDQLLARCGSAALCVAATADARKLGLRGTELLFFELLRSRPMNVASAIGASRLSEAHARRVLYALLVTRMLVAADESSVSGIRRAVSIGLAGSESRARSAAPPGAAGARSSRPPDSALPPSRSSRPSGAAALRRGSSLPAWQQLASMRPGSPADRRLRATQAAQAPERRSIPSAPLPSEVLDDTSKLRRAEQLAERGSHSEALRLIGSLLEHAPDNPEIHAVHALVLLQRPPGTTPLRLVHEAAARALRLDGCNVRALYARAMAYKRERRETESVAYLRRVLDLDAEHPQARSELRSAELRRKS